MKKAFVELPRPLICGSLRHRTSRAIIEDIKKSEAGGARSFILHIQLMSEEYRNYTEFKNIASSTECPIMAINYQTKDGQAEEQRLEQMFEAIRAGFRSVDVPAYTYDPDPKANPDEVSMLPFAIERQKTLIRDLKKAGAEVLMSAHVGVELTMEQTVSLSQEIQSRGADIVKIVARCDSKEQFIEVLRTNLELEHRLDKPFLYIIQGVYRKLQRLIAPLFGSMLIFGHHEYYEFSNRAKPIINEINDFYKILELEK